MSVHYKKQIMKPYLMLISCLFGLSSLFAQLQNKLIIRTDIKKIKLFLNTAEMTHESELKLTKGRNKIVFAGISAFADPRSIQFTANGNYRLVSVNSEIDFMAGENVNPKITELKDSLEVLQDKQQAKIDLLSSYQAEIGILNTNRDIKGKDQNLTVEQLKAVADFYRTRTFEINTKISAINKEKRIIDAKIDQTRNQLIELNYNENQRSNQVIILIDCDENQSIKGELKYLVSDCGWVASYDLLATDLSKPINLKYRAIVYNNTGNDWNNVQLTLSTADPLLSASAPKLNP
ncbi:MAG: mucoidy inhibitor MuiA family protein, partial [Fluviicola sp.]